MSAEGVQVLREAYAGIARGDVAAVMAGLDENIEWNVPESLPFEGPRRGHAAVGALFGELMQQVPDFHLELLEFIDGGDTVVALVRSSGTGPAGGFDYANVHVWRMRDGKAVSFSEFPDTAQVLRALGQEIAPSD